MASRNPAAYKRLVERLRELRVERGLTQVEVARRLGTRQQYVSLVETGERRLDPVECQELAELYGVEIGELVGSARPESDKAGKAGGT
jgi:transcriptional regulator with XRE-family HTH domain